MRQGWGCGYRSLQTLCSWAVKHSPSPSNNAVPTLPQIQQILVDIGDKEITFANSKQWIGCYEACIVIDQLYKVENNNNYRALTSPQYQYFFGFNLLKCSTCVGFLSIASLAVW